MDIMLALKLRANKEILTGDCSEPTAFWIYWNDIDSKQVKVAVDAEMSAMIYRGDQVRMVFVIYCRHVNLVSL